VELWFTHYTNIEVPSNFAVLNRTIYQYGISQNGEVWQRVSWQYPQGTFTDKHLKSYTNLGASYDSLNSNIVNNVSYNSSQDKTTMTINGINEKPILVHFTN
jgi:hypothetical protein